MPASLLRVATRGSKLALWQARHVLDLLPQVGLQGKLQIIKTSGDQRPDVPLYDFGGKGLFAKEIEIALCQRHADLAVHSLKDMPVQTTRTELAFVCVLPRTYAGDVLICHPRHRHLLAAKNNDTLLGVADLQRWNGLTIATGSLRRRYFLEQAAAVKIVALRGNVDTRLAQLRQGKFDALLLAHASLQRLGVRSLPYRVLDPTWFVPSCGQGTIAVQAPAASQYRAALARLDCAATRACVMIERAIIKALGGNCSLPFGCYVRRVRDDYVIDAVALSPHGRQARAACRLPCTTLHTAITAAVLRGLCSDGLQEVLVDLGLPTIQVEKH